MLLNGSGGNNTWDIKIMGLSPDFTMLLNGNSEYFMLVVILKIIVNSG